MACQCELNQDEVEALKSVFEYVLKRGKPPATEDLRLSIDKPEEEIIRILDRLEKKGDLLLRKKGTQEIISIYPLSLEPTQHRITLEDGTTLFAMCAVDALGMPIMFNRNVRITSRCEECKHEMVFEVKNGEIAFQSHPNAMICSPKSHVHPAAVTCCPLVNFFCCRKHADQWLANNPRLGGSITQASVRRRFPKIRECWKRYGETLGVR